MTLSRISLRASASTHSPDLNGKISSGSMNGFIVSWASTCKNNPRLEQRSLSLVEFGWRVGLYSKAHGGEVGMEIALKNALTVRDVYKILEFWPTIKDDEFTIRITIARMIQDLRARVVTRPAQPQQHEQADEEEKVVETALEFTTDAVRISWKQCQHKE
nr:hypothetical protein [Tanacetum cinerariifolium]